MSAASSSRVEANRVTAAGGTESPERRGRSERGGDHGPSIPPLLPILLPIVVAAIASGVLFAWWFPPPPAGTTPPAVRFTDVTAEAGLAEWEPPVTELSPTTLGGGVVCFDYDQDGLTDLFFVGGGPWPWEEPLAKRISRGSMALFHNLGNGRFADITLAAGLNVELQGMGAAAGDFDGDGWPDLYVTCVGQDRLFRNLGRGRFEDVTERAGLSDAENTWSTGALWLDYDNDGKLDLIVTHYARWPREVELATAFMVARVGRSYGAPAGFLGAFPTVYRNLGDGKFEALPGGAGLRDVDPQTGFPQAKALAVVPVDPNGDGRIDLMFSYHTADTTLYLNNGDGVFRRWTGSLDRRREGASANYALASSLPFVAADDGERYPVWQGLARRLGGGREVFLAAKLGAALLDVDQDGRLDAVAGGDAIEADTNQVSDAAPMGGVAQWWWNGGERWESLTLGGREETLPPVMARGVATLDFDGDGDRDVAVAQHRGSPRLWRNDRRAGLPWLRIELVAKHGPRDGTGARVEVHTPRKILVQTMMPQTSYLAQSESFLDFGLSEDARVQRIVVHWPGGGRQEVRPQTLNRRIRIEER